MITASVLFGVRLWWRSYLDHCDIRDQGVKDGYSGVSVDLSQFTKREKKYYLQGYQYGYNQNINNFTSIFSHVDFDAMDDELEKMFAEIAKDQIIKQEKSND